MKIIRSLEDKSFPYENSVVTIGNFDGVHLGHREIFRKLVSDAKNNRSLAVVFTFVPHPLAVLAPARAPQLINTYREKETLIKASCIDVLVCAPFTVQMAQMGASFFLEEILLKKLGVSKLVVGYDYSFGKGREGDTQFLLEQGEKLGFQVEIIKPISFREQIYSSTFIRKLIAEGKVDKVIPYLGRNFTLEGRVGHGFNRGKSLGYPTANLIADKKIIPCPGVYAVKVKFKAQTYDGVVNIGYNPTFSQNVLSVEVHIFEFNGMIYGETLRLYFVERLRDETLFKSATDLVKAIKLDVDRAREILAGEKVIEYHEYLDCPGNSDCPGTIRAEKEDPDD